MDISELKRLRPIIETFANNLNQNWGFLDTEKTFDRYHELYDMVQQASGDPKFRKYVQPINYITASSPHPLSRHHSVEILNSAAQLVTYMDNVLGNRPSPTARIRFPIGSPFGFTNEDWHTVEERAVSEAIIYVVLGYQFKSDYYDSDKLKMNIEEMFAAAINEYNNRQGHPAGKISFRPLAAGYGEHLFNEIARDIISSDIAVFETSDFNSNVMIEMGVALTWGVQVLPIKLQERPKPPSDISGQTWADYVESASRFVDFEHNAKLIRMIERVIRKKQGS